LDLTKKTDEAQWRPSSQPDPMITTNRHGLNATLPPGRSSLNRCLWRFLQRLGDQFDADKLEAYPPGSVIVLPGNTYHFHWAKSSEYITQVTAIGPLGLEYINAKDDPRNNDA
jgi:hypothetical protein